MEVLRNGRVTRMTPSVLMFLGTMLAGTAFAVHTDVGPFESQEACWNLSNAACIEDAEETCMDLFYGLAEMSLTKVECREYRENSGIFYAHCYFRCEKKKVPTPGIISDLPDER